MNNWIWASFRKNLAYLQFATFKWYLSNWIMRKTVVTALVLLVILQARIYADEGMWLLSLVKQVNMDEMTDLGLQLTAEQIYSINQACLKDAVGTLDRGSCTAELVSADGLLLTNHHCGYDEIQHHSTIEHDLLQNGFWAMTREEELPNEGKTVTFLIRMEEVTDSIVPKLNEHMDQQTRNARIRSLSGAIASEAIRGSDYEARVKSMFSGNRYFLFVTETYRDIRLVGAPPESIGKFGGDTDNWEYPRHTGDFSLFRVYTGPDGKPADYSPDNIPLKSKYFLPISLKGYDLGDFTMVIGFPGRTERYMTSWEINELLQLTNPNRIRIRGIKQRLLLEDMLADEEVRLQYAAKYSSSANYWKYSIGQSRGLKSLHVMERKQKQEEEFTDWVNQDSGRMELYGSALKDIREAVEARREVKNAEQYLTEAVRRGGGMESVYFARHLEALERALVMADDYPDGVRSVTEVLRLRADEFYRDYNPPTDRKVMKAMIDLLIEELDDQYLPFNILEVKQKYRGDAGKYVDSYFRKSFVVDREKFFAFLEAPSLKVLRKDPAYVASIASKVDLELIGELNHLNQQCDRGSRLYLKGLMEMHAERDFYSDANSTMRLNYGTVGDYFPRDAVHYSHYTTLAGVMEKEDPDNYEFFVPERLKELYAEKDYQPYSMNDTMNVCFISNNDITGGNSGSPVMNANGELIGIAFDGNWEAMSGDVAFEPELQKCINVDIRYVLFIIDKFAGAGHLIQEMSLVR
jgi:predicted DNA-binding protein